MENERQTEEQEAAPQSTWGQMGRYAGEGLLLTALAIPYAYMKWMRRLPLPWLSTESFRGFGTFMLVIAIVFVLVRIGSHGDEV